MDKVDEVMGLMEVLQVSDKHPIGNIMSAKGYWKPGVSASNNAYKILGELVSLNRLEKGNGFFRIPGCKSEYGEHARLLTRILAEILKLPFTVSIFREHTISAIGLRPDALILMTDHSRALCLVLEAVNQESNRSLETKRNVWNQWPDAKKYLSQLFGVTISHFDFVRSDELSRYLKEVIYGQPNRDMPHLFSDAGAGGVLQTTPEDTTGGS